MSFMRKSKFRHVFGKPLKKEQCYDALRISRSSWDSKFCAVNPKYVAIITESGGGSAFIVLPLTKVGRVDINAPQVCGHKGPIYDIAWCPHNDDIIASCSDDCTVKIWQIPEGGLTDPLTESIIDLTGHQRRATSIAWHPTAQNVLLTTGSDFVIMLWDVGGEQPMVAVTMPDQIYSLSFNEDGSQFACTCKDKKLRIMDSHTLEVLQEVVAHDGSKPPQCAFLKDNKVFTTGFSRMSERQYALWDLKKSPVECMDKTEVDTSNGVMFPFYDPDTSMVYLAGKGDSQIRYYEITDESPYVHFLNLYATSNPQKGNGFMPKRGLNANINEIARFYKLHNNGLCEVTPFTVPRKSELFQDDLYPDTASDMPSLTAEDFFAGKNGKPKLMSMKGEEKSNKREVQTIVRKSNILDRTSKLVAPAATNNSSNGAEEMTATTVAATSLPPRGASTAATDELKKEIEELKKIVSQQDKRIEALEGRISTLEKSNNTDEEEEEGEEAAA